MKKKDGSWLIDALFIAAITAFLIWPIFKTKYFDNWLTIDSTFIADGRYLSEHWPHPGWQPLWYGGNRFDYIYPPALRYGTAALTKLFPIIPARAYHLYTALFYVLGIACVYLFARRGSGSRAAAWLCAAGTALLSPTYLFLADIRADTQPYMPQRLNVLVRYGEGPHMTALALLPLGLFFAWRGLRAGQDRWLASAAIVFALVVSNNLYGATALAIFFPVLCWAMFTEWRDWRVWARAGAMASLVYGLSAFWLTPSFLRITSRNLVFVAPPGTPGAGWAAAALAMVFAGGSWFLVRKKVWTAWPVFVCGASVFLCLIVFGNYFLQFRLAGNPQRLVPEADLCLIMLGVLVLRFFWFRYPRQFVRLPLALLAATAFLPAWIYLREPWHHLTRTSEVRHLLEYQLPEWVAKNRPGTRTFTSGTSRFWWNAWFDEAMIGGGSDQGVQNSILPMMSWLIVNGQSADVDTLWFQAYAIDNLIVNDKTSQVHYAEFQTPQKYQSVLPLLWEDGKGNRIYSVPRKHPGLARVVDGSRFSTLHAPTASTYALALQSYTSMLEDPATPAANSRWLGADSLEIEAETRSGQALTVQVTFDDSWHARENGAEYPVSADPFGQMRVDVPPGRHKIEMYFDTPQENLFGRALTLLAAVVTGFLWFRRAAPL